MANIFYRPENHDYDMAINLIMVIMSYASQCGVGRSVASFIAAIRFLFFLFLFFAFFFAVI